MKPQEGHTFKVKPHENAGHVAGSEEIQTHDFIDYHLARDREQHSARELFMYKEASNETTFAVVVVEKIYAHESLTSNDTVVYEVNFKRKARLKEDMDAHSNMYVLSNGCWKSSDDSDGYYLEGYSILSLQGSLLRDIDVENNGNWSYAYAVGSQVYHEVCMGPDIASAGVGILDGFDRGLQTYVNVFVNFDYAMGGYLAKGTPNRVRIRAEDSSEYYYMCLVKGGSPSEVPA
nr:zinc finger, CCHC-type [Tanacetum cinerariifolium]